eukprot:Polyplicarium_translucidae@DN2053_c0_g1_i2.p1
MENEEKGATLGSASRKGPQWSKSGNKLTDVGTCTTTGDATPYEALGDETRPTVFENFVEATNTALEKLTELCSFCGYCPLACLTPRERGAVANLKAEAAVPFDATSHSHAALLETYWQIGAKACNGEVPSQMQIPSPAWKRLGFQSEDPRTDFRGGGALALRNMIYFATEREAEFHEIVSEACTYPFAAGFINVTFMMMLYLRLNKTRGRLMSGQGPVASRKGMKTFAKVCVKDQDSFAKLYCMNCVNLHRIWQILALSGHFTLMDFATPLREAQAIMVDAIESDMKDASDFERFVVPRGIIREE